MEVALRWSGVYLPTSTMVGPGGMAPPSLDGRCVLRYERRDEAQSITMVALAGLAKFIRIFTLKMAWP
jgi:hypothetical protein